MKVTIHIFYTGVWEIETFYEEKTLSKFHTLPAALDFAKEMEETFMDAGNKVEIIIDRGDEDGFVDGGDSTKGPKPVQNKVGGS